MTEIATFSYADQPIQLEGCETCSVSQFLTDAQTFYEANFLDSLKGQVEAGQWAVDVGAHIGNHSIYLAKILGLRVMAFEANPQTYTVLKRNIAANGLDAQIGAQNLALSDSKGMVDLNPLSVDDVGTYSLMGQSGEASVRVRSTTLDDFLDYFEDRPPALIKIDVENAEELVLIGGMETISRFRPLIATETMSVEAFDKIAARLQPLGYVPVSVHNATPTVTWSSGLPRGVAVDKVIANLTSLARYAVMSAVNAQASSVQAKTHYKSAQAVEAALEDSQLALAKTKADLAKAQTAKAPTPKTEPKPKPEPAAKAPDTAKASAPKDKPKAETPKPAAKAKPAKSAPPETPAKPEPMPPAKPG